jgi:predicted metalloprotease with PDZ domain
VLVWRVVPRSPAFYAGIQAGDVITTFHGQRVTGPDAFVQLVERAEPGTIAVEVNRNERVRQLDVELSQLEGRAAARTALRPEFDDPSIERLSERREERIEDRRDMRLEGGGNVIPSTRVPAAGPVRRALFPRLRGR